MGQKKSGDSKKIKSQKITFFFFVIPHLMRDPTSKIVTLDSRLRGNDTIKSMQIAIISDSHDNLPNIDKTLAYLKTKKIKTLIHCGDVCAPGVMKYLAEQFKGQIHLVFGNVDGDREKMIELAISLKNLKIHGEVGEVEIGGKKIAFTHYPWRANELAKTKKYDLIFYGHDHKAWEKTTDKTVLRNPGTLAGLFAKATFATYDPTTDKARLILLEKI